MVVLSIASHIAKAMKVLQTLPSLTCNLGHQNAEQTPSRPEVLVLSLSDLRHDCVFKAAFHDSACKAFDQIFVSVPSSAASWQSVFRYRAAVHSA